MTKDSKPWDILILLIFTLWGIYIGLTVHSMLIVLQTQVLRVGQANEPYIGLTQENSIKNSVQDRLPYILKPDDLC